MYTDMEEKGWEGEGGGGTKIYGIGDTVREFIFADWLVFLICGTNFCDFIKSRRNN